MSRHNLSGPIGVLAAGLVVIVMLLVMPDINPDATTRRQIGANGVAAEQNCPGYPNAQYNYIPTICPTSTSTPTTSGTPATSTPTASKTPATGTPTVTGTAALLTQTPSPSPTPTILFGGPVDEATETPEPTETATPTVTLTPTPSDQLLCAPGVPVEISGEGPPRAPFLLYFGNRAVSGGSVDPAGHFSIALTVGNERAGSYPVQVRLRGSSQVLRRLTCAVPVVTPTPMPDRRRPAL